MMTTITIMMITITIMTMTISHFPLSGKDSEMGNLKGPRAAMREGLCFGNQLQTPIRKFAVRGFWGQSLQLDA